MERQTEELTEARKERDLNRVRNGTKLAEQIAYHQSKLDYLEKKIAYHMAILEKLTKENGQ